ADLILTYGRRRESAEAVAAQARAKGASAEVRPLDPREGALEGLDEVGHMVWAAGADIGQPAIAEMSAAALLDALSLEVLGFTRVVQAVLPSMRRHRGSLVALSRAGLSRHPPGDALSTVPKAAMEALIQGVAREEGRHGVRAN